MKQLYLKTTIWVLISFLLIGYASAQNKPIKWSVTTANSFINKFPDPDSISWNSKSTHFDWQAGYAMYMFEKMWKATGDKRYFDYIKRYVDQQVDEAGNIPDFKPNALDHFIPGYAIIFMYEQTHQEKYKIAARKIFDGFKDYPRNLDGSFWHSTGAKNQIWVDGVFMGQIFMARYGKVMGESATAFNEVTKQMKLIVEHCQKPSGVLLHAWDESKKARWADKTTGLAPEVWSEGLGWYAVLIADVFDFLPKNNPDYPVLMAHLQKLCEGLKGCQDQKTGMWCQVVDKPEAAGNWNETSGTGMFIYLIKKSIEKGYIRKAEYEGVLGKAYKGMITKAKINNKGFVDIIDCSSIGVQDSYDVYIHKPHELNTFAGVTSFILGTMSMENDGQTLSNTGSISFPNFTNPPAEYRGVRWLGFGLSNLSDSSVIRSIKTSVKLDSWGSYLLGPGGGPTTGLSDAYLKASRRTPSDKGVVYLSEEYFRLYKLSLDEGMKYNFPMSTLYDEWNYPSGIVGGQFYSKYPELAAKSLEIVEKNFTGPLKTELEVPKGIYVGAVMMNLDTYQRIDISKQLSSNNLLKCTVPKGNWKVMGFYLNSAFRPQSQKGGFVDYLDKDAVAKYIELNFDPYYTHLKDYFGTVIKRTMYDEPAMHLMDGRMWTPAFNKEFEKRYHYSPMIYYPALWYSIGTETSAARNALFGFHADLFAENYIGQMAAWCSKHGINLGGHLDQEEARNPVAINGDLMKAFKYQQVPGHDDIYYPGRSNVSYKIISSVAYNYDRPECIAETYAAYRAMSTTIAMRTAMDQFTMGINVQLGSRPADIGPDMDRFVGRASYLLRGGRHVADIAVVYPIAALQSAYSFAGPTVSSKKGSSAEMYYALEGGIVPPETDYMNIGEMLFRSLRVDYTYLHPDVLVDKCTIENKELVLNNKVNRESYKVLILPGGDTFSALAAQKVLEFYRNGGTVIATSKLPSKSSEFNKDKEIRDMVAEVFGISESNPMTAEITILVDDFTNYFMNANKKGGHGYFLPNPELKIMEAVLKSALPVKDVDILLAPTWPVKIGTEYDGALTYLHKVKDGKDIFFFANSSDKAIDTKVSFRGELNPEVWNPHSGERQQVDAVKTNVNGQPITTVSLKLAPVSALFYVQ